MRISRDKLNKLAHTVADTLAEVDEVGRADLHWAAGPVRLAEEGFGGGVGRVGPGLAEVF